MAQFLILLAAFLIRISTAAFSGGFSSDTACFAAWADRIYALGPSGFYSPDVFTDYPPGYMYLLYPIGFLVSKTGLPYLGSLHLILLRLPSILCDCITGQLLYKEAKKKFSSSHALFFSALYLFNPAVILNSSLWGQVDSVFTLFLLCTCLFLIRDNLSAAYLTYAAALLIKPQALLFAPLMLFVFIKKIFLQDFSLKKLLLHLGQIFSACLLLVLCSLPFGLKNVWQQYFSTVDSYPYASVNAYNFWALFGKSWVSQSEPFLGLPMRALSSIFILLICGFTAYLYFRPKKERTNYPFLFAFLLISIFTFSVRMHERYLYPAMLFLLLAFLYQPAKELFYFYIGFSLLHFCNTAHVLFCYDPQNYNRTAPAILLISGGTAAMTLILYAFIIKKLFFKAASPRKEPKAPFQLPVPPKASAPGLVLKRADWCILLLLTLLYSGFALYDLGDTKAPVTGMTLSQKESITLNFGASVPVSLHYYIAPWHGRNFLIEELNVADNTWTNWGYIQLNNVFNWQETALPGSGTTGQIRLTLSDDSASLLELVFLDGNGNVLPPLNAADYPALFDEASLYPARSSFRNGTYFDEIYHARTAYEFLLGLPAYENTHPPLGKILIALGIALFGMNPFGWRIIGTLFGIAMVPFSYLFARKLTDNIPVSALICTFFTFDFMHFTQTRIATIDVYITFFVILMYFFLYCYCQKSFYDTPLVKTFLPLGACGICMGLGIASKWTGVYAGLGLAVLFFATLFQRYREYLFARSAPNGSTNGISHRQILSSFREKTLKTILFCLLFFVLVPAVIYLLSYLPFQDYSEDNLLLRLIHNQQNMFRYHSTLNATHPYSSSWYEWPIIKRPIWYYSGILTGSAGSGGIREGISAFGNPLVWWAGIPAFFYMLFLIFTRRDKKAGFLTIGYLAQYLPWFFVTRITFIYHYFPSVIFVALMDGYSVLQLKKHLSARCFAGICFLLGISAFLLFLLFYPVLSGQPIDAAYVARWLRWFPGWVLVSG